MFLRTEWPPLTPLAPLAARGRDRFCSDRCLDAFDEGWPVYGTTPADYVRVVEHRKLKAVPRTTRKARKRVLRPAKGSIGLFRKLTNPNI